MANFKIVVSDSETRKTSQKDVDQSKAAGLIGRKIGDEVSGDIVEMPGYTLKITGGSDKDGFPMHPSVKGQVKKRVLLTGPPGYHPDKKGKRKRKIVRGDTVSADTIQINLLVLKKPAGGAPAEPEKKEEKKQEQAEAASQPAPEAKAQ
jgi:small subunit ribosomal protein S6e